MDLAPAIRRATVSAISVEDVGFAVVDDGVDGIEAQPVEMELLEPVKRVLDIEIAHRPLSGRRNRSRRPRACDGAR